MSIYLNAFKLNSASVLLKDYTLSHLDINVITFKIRLIINLPILINLPIYEFNIFIKCDYHIQQFHYYNVMYHFNKPLLAMTNNLYFLLLPYPLSIQQPKPALDPCS